MRELSVAIGDASPVPPNTQAPGMAWVFFALRRRFFIPPPDLPHPFGMIRAEGRLAPCASSQLIFRRRFGRTPGWTQNRPRVFKLYDLILRKQAFPVRLVR